MLFRRQSAVDLCAHQHAGPLCPSVVHPTPYVPHLVLRVCLLVWFCMCLCRLCLCCSTRSVHLASVSGPTKTHLAPYCHLITLPSALPIYSLFLSSPCAKFSALIPLIPSIGLFITSHPSVYLSSFSCTIQSGVHLITSRIAPANLHCINSIILEYSPTLSPFRAHSVRLVSTCEC